MFSRIKKTLPHQLNLTLLAYAVFFCVFLAVLFKFPNPLQTTIEYGHFFVVGLIGALVANSTGAGGGVIFVPFFSALNMSAKDIIGTSLAIQSFGMTAGAISWLKFLRLKVILHQIPSSPVKKILFLAGLSTLAGVIAGQHLLPQPTAPIEKMFSVFSIFFGIILLVTTLIKNQQTAASFADPQGIKSSAILFTCFVGGIITSWISIGVGEAIAILLFLLGYPAYFAVAVGVFCSSVAVLSAVFPYIVNQNIVASIVIFAGMAALIGGYVARYITHRLGAFYLKLFFATWIFLSGLFMLN